MPGKKGLVSIIIPTHNRAGYLKKAITSALQQSYPNIEIIIIANGCHDGTDDVVGQLKKDFPQLIVYLVFSETLGGARARNLGIDKASGEYIAFLDDDDRWHPNKLRDQIALLNQRQYAIVGCNLVYVYGQPERHKYARPPAKRRINIEDLYDENSLGGFSGCLTKKTYIAESRINEKLDALQDWDLYLKILRNTKLPAYINPAHHVYYRIDADGISGNYQQVIDAQRVFLDAWRCVLGDNNIYYHKMRTNCLAIKTMKRRKYRRYLATVGSILIAVFSSHYRYSLKKYLHYLALPLLDINQVRIWCWSKFQ